jgi:hypothetical protein
MLNEKLLTNHKCQITKSHQIATANQSALAQFAESAFAEQSNMA